MKRCFECGIQGEECQYQCLSACGCAHMHIYVRAYVQTFTHMYMQRVNAVCVLVKLGGVWAQCVEVSMLLDSIFTDSHICTVCRSVFWKLPIYKDQADVKNCEGSSHREARKILKAQRIRRGRPRRRRDCLFRRTEHVMLFEWNPKVQSVCMLS